MGVTKKSEASFIRGRHLAMLTPILGLPFISSRLGLVNISHQTSALAIHSKPPSKRFSMHESMQAINRMAATLDTIVPQCGVKTFGGSWGAHELCDIAPKQPCFFYSFGISTEYSFDLDVANRWGCYGFAADPTIDHPSKLHPNITFHSIAAKMREQSMYPLVTSMPALRQWLGHSRVAVLKMDCEGCEYSLGEDIENEDPTFFEHIDQFAVEVHTSKKWLNSKDHLHALGLLFLYLERAGHVLQHANIGPCAYPDEATGCLEELEDMGYPCGIGKSCHNYLFAKVTNSRRTRP